MEFTFHRRCVSHPGCVVAKNVLAQLAFVVVTPTLKLIKYNYYNITTLLYFLGKDNRIPDVVARATRRIRPLTPATVPSVQDAIQMYTNAGGVLTSECSFGNDPLADDGALRNRRDAEFVQNNPSFSQIFENVIIGNGALMETAILSFINITRYLSP